MPQALQLDVADEVGKYFADMVGYLRFAWPWQEKGSGLEHFDGPEYWVLDLADEISNHIAKNGFNGHDPVDPIYVAVSSGNGAAKSAFAGMLNNFIMSTRPGSRVTVFANTGNQLRTKTWPQIQKWTNLSITKDWFDIGAEYMRAKEDPYEWFAAAHTWNIANPTASAGQHARTASSVFIGDEASGLPEIILGEMGGGLTDGEPFMILLGNCTNRGSRLFRATFGDLKKFYIHRSIDTRKCKYTNKKQIEQWRLEKGEDSDWFKAHVKGEAPNADDLQLIDNDRVQQARRRDVKDPTAPLIMGLDFARGGKDNNWITYRQGRDGKPHPSRKINGDKTRDTTLMVDLVAREIEEKKPDAVCGDSGAMGGPIMDQLRKRFKAIPVIDVIFGGAAPDEKYLNMRAYIWDQCRLWLMGGSIDDDEQLELDLTGPHAWENDRSRLQLESKEDMEERGLASPDRGDSFCCTFAYHGMPRKPIDNKRNGRPAFRPTERRGGRGWMRR